MNFSRNPETTFPINCDITINYKFYQMVCLTKIKINNMYKYYSGFALVCAVYWNVKVGNQIAYYRKCMLIIYYVGNATQRFGLMENFIKVLWRAVTEWESSAWDWGSLMTSWLWLTCCLGVSVQGHWMPSCYGNAPPKEALCRSLMSLDLDLRHIAPRYRGILLLDNRNVYQLCSSWACRLNRNFKQWASLSTTQTLHKQLWKSCNFLSAKNNACIVFNLIMRHI